MPSNPWAGLSFKVEGSDRRRPFTREELQTIFAGPLFDAYAIPDGAKTAGAAAYWLPLLGLFSGARVGELAQLEVRDVRLHDGVHVLAIHEEAEGSTLKTAASVRLVPIHSALVALGFLDYVAAMKKAREPKLWPTLHRGGRRSPGEVFTEAFRAYLDGRGITAKLLTFHSLRHVVRSALVAAEATEPVIDSLLGHAQGGSTGRRNYTHLGLPTLQRGSERLAYPFLRLSRVYAAP
jgi:integrase